LEGRLRILVREEKDAHFVDFMVAIASALHVVAHCSTEIELRWA